MIAAKNALPGSIKTASKDGADIVYRMQSDGRWVVADSSADVWEEDLQDAASSGKLGAMTKTRKEPSLIPNAEVYIANGLNLLLVGPHGTGKTATIKEITTALGLKVKYYSCSTLDPYTDLIGIPTPRHLCSEHGEFETRAEHVNLYPECKEETMEFLKNVRPHDLDEAEFLFFDEFNRADPKTLNALFEIIQFKTLNGEPLPNLKVCWAAMNPPGDEQGYEVDKVDPALLDRFDLYVMITAKVSVTYMETQGIPKLIGAALQAWYNEHARVLANGDPEKKAENYISPRRLEKLGHVWLATKGDSRALAQALPMGGTFDRSKLANMLKAAQAKLDRGETPADLDETAEGEYSDSDWDGDGLGDQPNPDFSYTPANLAIEAATVAKWLKEHPNHFPTHQKVAETLKVTMGGTQLLNRVPQVLDGLNPSILEAYVAAFPLAKQKSMCDGYKTLYRDNQSQAESYKNLHAVLAKSPGAGSDFPTI